MSTSIGNTWNVFWAITFLVFISKFLDFFLILDRKQTFKCPYLHEDRDLSLNKEQNVFIILSGMSRATGMLIASGNQNAAQCYGLGTLEGGVGGSEHIFYFAKLLSSSKFTHTKFTAQFNRMVHCEDTNTLGLHLPVGCRSTCPHRPVPIGDDLFGEKWSGQEEEGGKENMNNVARFCPLGQVITWKSYFSSCASNYLSSV